MTEDEAYKTWWHNEGSGIIPLPNEDMEEFAHRITEIAWSNSAFKERKACWEIACDYTQKFSSHTCLAIADEIRARGQA